MIIDVFICALFNDVFSFLLMKKRDWRRPFSVTCIWVSNLFPFFPSLQDGSTYVRIILYVGIYGINCVQYLV